MRFALLCAAILASSALALELHPGGALVPEETRAVAEARNWHEAAMEAALENDEAELEEVEEGSDADERQLGGRCIGCRPRRFCCRLPRCRRRPICRGFPG
jgi:hypothetical protein